MTDALHCVNGENVPANTNFIEYSFSFWAENLRECSGASCPGGANGPYDADEWKSVGDAARLFAPDFAGIIMGFMGLMQLFAFLELLGYTLGSKCQAWFAIILSLISFA